MAWATTALGALELASCVLPASTLSSTWTFLAADKRKMLMTILFGCVGAGVCIDVFGCVCGEFLFFFRVRVWVCACVTGYCISMSMNVHVHVDVDVVRCDSFGAKTGLPTSACSGACPAGWYSVAGSMQCLPCAPGYYGAAAALDGTVNGSMCTGTNPLSQAFSLRVFD